MDSERTQQADREFQVGNLADDLVELTLTLCNKDAEHNPRFPERLYDSYVKCIVDTALSIQKHAFIANDDRSMSAAERKRYQSRAEAECIYLNHLIRIAGDKGWISDKQRERWQKQTDALRWKIYWWRTAK